MRCRRGFFLIGIWEGGFLGLLVITQLGRAAHGLLHRRDDAGNRQARRADTDLQHGMSRSKRTAQVLDQVFGIFQPDVQAQDSDRPLPVAMRRKLLGGGWQHQALEAAP